MISFVFIVCKEIKSDWLWKSGFNTRHSFLVYRNLRNLTNKGSLMKALMKMMIWNLFLGCILSGAAINEKKCGEMVSLWHKRPKPAEDCRNSKQSSLPRREYPNHNRMSMTMMRCWWSWVFTSSSSPLGFPNTKSNKTPLACLVTSVVSHL